MSYEGYVQRLCEDGHYSTVEAYFTSNDMDNCPVLVNGNPCAKPIAWTNDVDQTNDNGDDTVVTLTRTHDTRTHTCECGNVHTIEPDRFHIPTDKGWRISISGKRFR